ncbi:MAG: lysophospholipid acyltransferase family protein [Caulobacteraceae bacterium]|nr:lysophospholipid acyltransferase family protein [Caulobacteraceae bacterium]
MARTRSPALRDLAWRLEAAGYDLFTAFLRALPIDLASWLGGWTMRRIGPLGSAHRTADLGLRIAFPDLDAAARKRLLAAQWDNFGRYLFEFPLLDRVTTGRGRIAVVGAERLAAIARGSPVVFVSGHLSSLEVMPIAILEAGIPCEITYRAANNPYVDARIRRSRARYGVTLFAPKGAEGGRRLLEAMRDGRSVAMMNDQRYDEGPRGVFFGHPVNTNPAAVRLALRGGAAIQPMSIERTRGARFRVHIHEPIVPERTGDRARDLAAGVQAINAFIEARVRERPGDWWWMHRRWPAEVYAEVAARSD